MTWASIKAWLMQPTTIKGFGYAAATAAGLIANAVTHDVTWIAAAVGSAMAIVHVVIPDNSAAQSSVEKLVTDTVTAAANKRLAEALPTLIQEGLAVVSTLKTTTTTTTIPVTVAGGGCGPVNS